MDTTISIQDIKEGILGNLGVLVVFIIILYTGWKKIWVWGWYAQELKQRNEKLEVRIDRISGAAKGVASLAETSISALEQKSEASGV